MRLLPASGETLWTDDPKRFAENIRGVNDPVLLEAAHNLRDKGYVHLKSVIEPGRIDQAVAAYKAWCNEHQELAEGRRNDGRLPRVVNLHAALPDLRNLYGET